MTSLGDQPSDTHEPEPPAGGQTERGLDAVDQRVVGALVRDGRVSIRTLAAELHISRTNAYARVERLLRDGVITGFHARIAPERAGLGTSAFVGLTIEQDTWREVSAALRQVRYVEHVALLAGDIDVLTLVRAPDNAALRDHLLHQMQSIPGVVSTRTWLVFEEFDGPGTTWG